MKSTVVQFFVIVLNVTLCKAYFVLSDVFLRKESIDKYYTFICNEEGVA